MLARHLDRKMHSFKGPDNIDPISSKMEEGKTVWVTYGSLKDGYNQNVIDRFLID